jgi:hypothetical protein
MLLSVAAAIESGLAMDAACASAGPGKPAARLRTTTSMGSTWWIRMYYLLSNKVDFLKENRSVEKIRI